MWWGGGASDATPLGGRVPGTEKYIFLMNKFDFMRSKNLKLFKHVKKNSMSN
jgi:hypothetical protein